MPRRSRVDYGRRGRSRSKSRTHEQTGTGSYQHQAKRLGADPLQNYSRARVTSSPVNPGGGYSTERMFAPIQDLHKALSGSPHASPRMKSKLRESFAGVQQVMRSDSPPMTGMGRHEPVTEESPSYRPMTGGFATGQYPVQGQSHFTIPELRGMEEETELDRQRHETGGYTYEEQEATMAEFRDDYRL